MNSRGCAGTDVLSPHIYSGGYTDDLRIAIAHIQKRLAPNTPLVAIGFSLGANVLVKVSNTNFNFIMRFLIFFKKKNSISVRKVIKLH